MNGSMPYTPYTTTHDYEKRSFLEDTYDAKDFHGPAVHNPHITYIKNGLNSVQ